MRTGRPDVIVAGASTTGLVTALALARAGLVVDVLDIAEDEAGSTAPPPLAWSAVHHWSVLPILEEIGVLDAALVAGEATARWGLRVLASGEQLDFDIRDLRPETRHPFNLRLEPHRLRALLTDELLRLPGAAVIPTGAVSGLRQEVEGVEVALADGRRIEAGWLVGADGPTSGVRRAAGLGFEGTTWTERGVVALVDHDFTARGYADTTLQVDGRAGAVVERVGRTTWRYVFQESLALDPAGTEERLSRLLREVTGEEVDVLEVATARMHQRSATSYRAGRVLLVGGAAHVTHPISGHAPLGGWFDAASLAPVLAGAITTGDQAPVSEWAARRRRVFLDDAAPASLGRRNLVAQIRDPQRLEIELDVFRRASVDATYRREVLRADYDAVVGDLTALPPF